MTQASKWLSNVVYITIIAFEILFSLWVGLIVLICIVPIEWSDKGYYISIGICDWGYWLPVIVAAVIAYLAYHEWILWTLDTIVEEG